MKFEGKIDQKILAYVRVSLFGKAKILKEPVYRKAFLRSSKTKSPWILTNIIARTWPDWFTLHREGKEDFNCGM